MDTQTLINVAFTGLGGLASLILKATWDAITKLQTELSMLQKSIADTYVRKDDFRDHAERVEKVLNRIDAKLDHKADRV